MKLCADPICWLWFALVVSGICLLRRRCRKSGFVLLALALLGSGVETFKIPARLLASLERPYLASASPLPSSSDVVLVLGGYGQDFPASSPGIELNERGDRLIKGIELVRLGKAGVLVLSGGPRGNPPEPQDARAAQAWINSWKLVPGRVEVLGPSLNTHDEALQMRNLAQTNSWKKITLVTSAWHMRRAAATFRKTGLDISPVGSDFQGTAALQDERVNFIPSTASLVLLKLWLEESLGYAYYRLRGFA